MEYKELKQQEKEQRENTHLEYLKVSEEIKEALVNVERKTKEKNTDIDEMER